MPTLEATTDRAQLADRVRLAVTRLNRRLRQQAESGLSASAQSALASVARRGSVSLGELAVIEGVKPPSMTATIAALEAQMVVRREPDPADRRVTRVVITPRGRLRLQRTRRRKTAYLAGRLEGVDEHRLRALEEAVGVLEELLEETPSGSGRPPPPASGGGQA
jgi:DNA-binding MarR family transcriptional regulator